jgi:hypothetical protein
MTPMSKPRKLPLGLKPANRVVVALQRLGVSFGPMGLLSVPGRKSGRMQNTPVSPLTVEGRRYLVAVFDGADWAKNARAAGWEFSPGAANKSGCCSWNSRWRSVPRCCASCRTKSPGPQGSCASATGRRTIRRHSRRWHPGALCSASKVNEPIEGQ